MRTFNFGQAEARHIDRHGSDFSIARLVYTPDLHVACMRLGAGGLVGHHPAVSRQVFAVVEGSGWVRGDGLDRVPIEAGQAAFWESGEEHSAGTDTGMVAIVVEGESLAAEVGEIGPVAPRAGAGEV